MTQILLSTEERGKHGLAHSIKPPPIPSGGFFYLLAEVSPDIGLTNLIPTR